jgi:MSHA biogenesis protein MshI
LTFSSNGELCIARRFDVTRAQLIDADAGMRESYHERVALEIQRSLDHFGRQFSSTVVSKLDVAPVGDDDGGLAGFLRENLDVKVETLNLESLFNLSAVPELKQLDNQARYFSLLGAALRVEEKTL